MTHSFASFGKALQGSAHSRLCSVLMHPNTRQCTVKSFAHFRVVPRTSIKLVSTTNTHEQLRTVSNTSI